MFSKLFLVIFLFSSFCFSTVSCFDIVYALFDREITKEKAEKALARSITEDELDIIFAAHRTGRGELGKDKVTEASLYNYTEQHLKRKAELLRAGGFNQEERRTLMETGVVGQKFVELKNGSKMNPVMAFAAHRYLKNYYTTHKEIIMELIGKLRKKENPPYSLKHLPWLREEGLVEEDGSVSEIYKNIIECSAQGEVNDLKFPLPFKNENYREPLEWSRKDRYGRLDLILLSEADPQAFGYLDRITRTQHDWSLLFLYLEKMNIRGMQVTVAYYSYAMGDFNKLVEGIRNKDPKLVDAINKGMPESYPHQAKYFNILNE